MTLTALDLFLISPTSLTYIPSFLLQLCFLGYLLFVPKKSTATWLLIGWLSLLATMIGSQILAYSVYAPVSSYINWLGGILPGFGAVLLFIQFAYRYPRFLFVQEARRALQVWTGIIVGTAVLMLCEFLFTPGTIFYHFERFTYDMLGEPLPVPFNSPLLFTVVHPLGYVWALVVWLRTASRLYSDQRQDQQRQDQQRQDQQRQDQQRQDQQRQDQQRQDQQRQDQQGQQGEAELKNGRIRLWSWLGGLAKTLWRPETRDLATVRSYILFMVGAPFLTLILRAETVLSWVPPGSFAAAFLVALFWFGLIYINSSPQPTSVMVKIVGISLVTLLSLMGFLNQYVMTLRQETHLAQRNGEVSLIQRVVLREALTPEENLPTSVAVDYILRRPLEAGLFSAGLDSEILDSEMSDFELSGETLPRFSLLMDEAVRLREGIAQGDLVAERAAAYQLGGRTYSAVSDLLQESTFDPIRLYRGVLLDPTNHYARYLFTAPHASGEQFLYEVGYSYLAYRRLLHQTALPLLGLTLLTTVGILLLFPLFFRASFVTPLNNLLAGVNRIGQGNLKTAVPVSVEDEIGFLTRSFNRMGQSLHTLTTDLRHQISERQQAEAEARASARRFRQLFENAPLAIFEIDLSSGTPAVLNANRRAELIYGWSAEEFAQMAPERLILPAAQAEMERMLGRVQAGETVTFETTHLRRDGLPFPVRLSATPDYSNVSQNGDSHDGLRDNLRDNLHDNLHMIVIAQDITIESQRRSEEEAVAEDRRRIAREMHDSLAQTLAGLRMRARIWQRLLDKDPAQLHPELEEMRAVLDESIAEVRRSIFALRPLNLEELGFFPALHHFVEDFSAQTRLPIQIEVTLPDGVEEVVRLPAHLDLNLFRAVQECLNNAVRHAQASAVSVGIDLSDPDQIKILVADDGKGFDPAALASRAKSGHIGLKQMRERIESVNGQLLIFSEPGQGTEIQICVPIPAHLFHSGFTDMDSAMSGPSAIIEPVGKNGHSATG